jgi:GNAT superfamily N-acetyltransferase
MTVRGEITLRTARREDLSELLALYRYLHPNDPVLPINDDLQGLWHSLLADSNSHYILACCEERLISTCVLTVIPNLTRGARPYGLIENVVTHPDFRKQGFGTRILQFALDIAWKQNCYKVMLLTGRKDEAVLRFYEGAGFVRDEKTSFLARPTRMEP